MKVRDGAKRVKNNRVAVFIKKQKRLARLKQFPTSKIGSEKAKLLKVRCGQKNGKWFEKKEGENCLREKKEGK